MEEIELDWVRKQKKYSPELLPGTISSTRIKNTLYYVFVKESLVPTLPTNLLQHSN